MEGLHRGTTGAKTIPFGLKILTDLSTGMEIARFSPQRR